jgi:GNAT superfamily N-acetyltransferase
MNIKVRQLEDRDAGVIAAAFMAIGWESHKPLAQYQNYFTQQIQGVRSVLVAYCDGSFAGYVTILWESTYRPFRESEIPEVNDFNVLPEFRRRKIGTLLMDEAERQISKRSSKAGIGVGMYPDYGNAQRLYVLRGYVPDGRGLTYAGKVLAPMDTAINDDDLVLYFTKDLIQVGA